MGRGGLPQSCPDDVLSNYFMQYGNITDCVVMKERMPALKFSALLDICLEVFSAFRLELTQITSKSY
eukprot:3064246-Amphidinium_carterae.1